MAATTASVQEVHLLPDLAELGGARFDASRLEPGRLPGRKSSKSVSGARPPLSTSASSHRAFYPESSVQSFLGSGSSNGTPSPQSANSRNRGGLKRRISTPNLAKRALGPDEDEEEPSETPQQLTATLSATSNVKAFETRARSTSTSIVVPQTLQVDSGSPTQPVQTLTHQPQPHPQLTTNLPAPPPWASMYVTPPSPADTEAPSPSSGILSQAYDMGETLVSRALAWAQPRGHPDRRDPRRSSDEDSEKGLDGSEPETFDDDDDGQERVGLGRNGGRYWGLFSEVDESYFALPPTPPDDQSPRDLPFPHSLPTPALSTQSLSRGNSRRSRRRRPRSTDLQGGPADGWWVRVYRTWISSGSGTGKTTEVLRELGWTVAMLAGLFVVSFLLVVYAVQSMPLTHLQSMPKSTTDLQLLSAEIRAYMASGTSGWWHTVGVLTYIGCWKHAWSVPGAVVLNILVGSVFEPLAALVLLTLITACGSLGAYSLSRPLAPLIAVLFPKPLALVRAALAPESVPKAPGSHVVVNETLTPLQVSDDPAEAPIGAPADRPNVWRRLLLMRAMGFVPWSGMNVACGVVGVHWRTFWLTTAAGSASWSYVTASVGNILSRLALPASAAAAEENPGESLTSLLRDPTLIAKLVFLTLLTLIPVLLKRRTNPIPSESEVSTPSSTERPTGLGLNTTGLSNSDDEAPASPLATSLATFTPTPAVFDLLSFGRTAIRQGMRFVGGSARSAVGTAKRLVGNLRS